MSKDSYWITKDDPEYGKGPYDPSKPLGVVLDANTVRLNGNGLAYVFSKLLPSKCVKCECTDLRLLEGKIVECINCGEELGRLPGMAEE